LRDGIQAVGNYHVVWKGTDNAGKAVPSGMYLVGLRAGKQSTIKKMLLSK
jgi:hypothetical protein